MNPDNNDNNKESKPFHRTPAKGKGLDPEASKRGRKVRDIRCLDREFRFSSTQNYCQTKLLEIHWSYEAKSALINAELDARCICCI
jgi:hypothetical protein